MSSERSELSDERSAPQGAVFLSYASQDAAAAKRICEALRAAGVEVWFDQNELVGGDAWDAKIRKQIGSCALFVPIISANTQARTEGYFRLEWRLADKRTELMGKSRTFLLPVCIDTTRDAEADVPDSFLTVQWTRLPSGEATPAFCARVRRILEPTAFVPAPALPSRTGGGGRPVRRARFGIIAVVALAVIAGGVGLYSWRDREPASGSTATQLPATEAQKFIAQARQIIETSDEIHRENLFLAEDLVKRALALEPANLEALLLGTRLSESYVWYQIDNSRARRELLMQQANRALALAPQSTDARLARLEAQNAILFTHAGASAPPDLEQEARAMVGLAPGNWRTHRILGGTLRFLGRWEESIAAHRRALELSNGNPSAAADLVNVLFRARQYDEAMKVLRNALASQRSARLLCWEVMVNLRWSGDAAAAREAVKTWPGWLTQEDRGIYHAWLACIWSRRPDEARRVASLAVRDMVRDVNFYGPVAALQAIANEQAGNREAALADWRAVLDRSETELRSEPNNEPGLYWKAWSLARLDRIAEAKPIVAELTQRNQQGSTSTSLAPLQLLVGEKQAAIVTLRRRLNSKDDSFGVTRAELTLDPHYDRVRGDPEFQALLREAPAPSPADAPPTEPSPAPSEKSVAVLAFANLSDDKAAEFFSDGVSEELLNVLAKVPGLKVSARTSAFSFKGRNVPVAEIARQLGVAYVVEGSVRRSGEKVRISAQLIKAADGFQVWSDTFTRDLQDTFAVQDEIAATVARNLSLKLGATRAPTPAAATNRSEVLPLYYAALQAWNLRTAEGLDRAERLLDQALALDPTFARGHAALAAVWLIRGELTDTLSPFGLRNGEVARRVEAKLADALRLDPECAEAYAVRGALGWDIWQWDRGLADVRRATELNPNFASAYQWMGRILAAQGRVDEAIASLRRAVEVDPLSPRIFDNYGRMLLLAGRPREALAAAERALELQPGAMQPRGLKAEALARLGQSAAALEIARSLPTDLPIVSIYKVGALAAAGRTAELEPLLPHFTAGGHISKIGALTALGRVDEALAAFDPDWITATRWDMLILSPLFDPLRSDPRFAAALQRLGQTEAYARAQAWRAAHPVQKDIAP